MTAITNISGTYFNISGAWSTGTVPITGDTVTIAVGTMNVSGYNVACRSVAVNTGCGFAVQGGANLTLDDHSSAAITGAGTLTLTGSQTNLATIGPGTAPTNPWTYSVSNTSSVYGLIRYAKTTPKLTMHLTDSELGFYPQTNPEEQNVSGPWSMTRSRVFSYGSKYYLKPMGNVSMYESYLDGCLPSVYSTSHYIIAYDMPQYAGRDRSKQVAVQIPLGGEGEFAVDTGYGSRTVTFNGTALWDNASSYNHPLGHRVFVARMNTLKDDPNEIVKLTWCEGHFAAGELTVFNSETDQGRDFKTGRHTYIAVFKERPYQAMT